MKLLSWKSGWKTRYEATYSGIKKNWGIHGFNNHEDVAFKEGYIEKYFPHYLPLKKELLIRRDSAKNDTSRKFFGALYIYVYTIFENLWYGYIMSYAKELNLCFKFGKANWTFKNPYQTHLPSFSSAIVHLGTCRDLFFILLKLCIEPESVKDSNAFRELIEVR